MRTEQQTLHESQHSKDAQRNPKDDKAKLKKRNLLEVFKKPSNAKEIGKPTKQRTSPHVIDKFELECIEILKVSDVCDRREIQIRLQNLKFWFNTLNQFSLFLIFLNQINSYFSTLKFRIMQKRNSPISFKCWKMSLRKNIWTVISRNWVTVCKIAMGNLPILLIHPNHNLQLFRPNWLNKSLISLKKLSWPGIISMWLWPNHNLFSFHSIYSFKSFFFALDRILFSPPFTNDEEKDAAIHKRIRQLSWINARHLVCSIDEVNADVRDLVYCSINGKREKYCFWLNIFVCPPLIIKSNHTLCNRINFNGFISITAREARLHCTQLSKYIHIAETWLGRSSKRRWIFTSINFCSIKSKSSSTS